MEGINFEDENIKHYFQEFLRAGMQEKGFNHAKLADAAMPLTEKAINRYLSKNISKVPTIRVKNYDIILGALGKEHQDFVNFVEGKTVLQKDTPQTVYNTTHGEQSPIITSPQGDVNISFPYSKT